MRAPVSRLIITHGMAILVGLVLAILLKQGLSALNPASTPSHGGSPNPAGSYSSSTSHVVKNLTTNRTALRTAPGTASRASSEDFRQAWDLLTMQPMKLIDRYKVRGNLIVEWAEIDLAAALRFAQEQNVQAGSLQTIFARHPLESWKLLTTGISGMKGDEFREAWLDSVIQRDSNLTLSLLGEMPSWMQDRAVPALYARSADPGFRKQLIEHIQQISVPPQQLDRWMQQLTQSKSTDGN